LQDDGWYLRNAIVWHKPNAMPESVRDRLSVRYETVFLLVKSARYWFDLDPIREPHTAKPQRRFAPQIQDKAGRPSGIKQQSGCRELSDTPTTSGNPLGRNPGDVWSITTKPLTEAHFATFPIELPRRCILAGCRPDGTVLDPFSGAGTTALAAQCLGRRAIGIDLSAEYHDIALKRMSDAPLPFSSPESTQGGTG
jgi:site-specific DNA-methyltransferase (cytosine-N4-specific)